MCKLKTRNRVYMRIRVNNEVIKSKENFPVIAIFLTTSTYLLVNGKSKSYYKMLNHQSRRHGFVDLFASKGDSQVAINWHIKQTYLNLIMSE